MIVNCFLNQFVFSVIIIPKITGIVVTGRVSFGKLSREWFAGIKFSLTLKMNERSVTVVLRKILTEKKQV